MGTCHQDNKHPQNIVGTIAHLREACEMCGIALKQNHTHQTYAQTNPVGESFLRCAMRGDTPFSPAGNNNG